MSALLKALHHVDAPYVLEGGGDGTSGLNLWIRKDSAKFGAGDRMVIHTPGGGG